MNEPLHNTVLLVSRVVLASVPVGSLLAILLERTDMPARRPAWVALLALLFLPLYLQATAWEAGFGRQGWWAYQTQSDSTAWLSDLRGAVWVHSCAAIPWTVLLVSASLRFVSPQWEELASLEAGPWRVLMRVTMPRALPGIVAAGLWSAVVTASEMAVTDVYQLRTYAEAVYLDQVAGADWDQITWGVAGNVLAVCVLFGAAATVVWIAGSPRAASPRGGGWRFALGVWRWPAAVVVGTVVVGLWFVPLANLVYKAGVEVRWESERRVREWSPQAATRQVLRAPGEFQDEFYWTGLIGAGAATLAVCVIWPLAWYARRSRVGAVVGCALAALSWAVPGPLLSLLLVRLRDLSPGDTVVWLFDSTLVVLIVVHAWRAIPLVWLILLDACRTFPQAEWETAAVAGAGVGRRWFWLVWPRRRGSLLAAWVVAVVVSLAEVATSLLVGPQGVETLAVRTSQLVHTGVDDRLAGLALVTILLAWGLAWVVVALGDWANPRADLAEADL